jgi:hypothetical protein
VKRIVAASVLVIAASCGGSQKPAPQAAADAPDAASRFETASGAAAVSSPTSATESPVAQACKRRNDDPFDAFDLSGEQMLARRGLGDRTFADTASSLDAPIEVCGLMSSLDYLTRMTCADGSRPWGADKRKAHSSRSGSRQGKPRCGDIGPMIDRYEVPCPEARYAVFIDMYECGPGEKLMPD